MRYSGANRQQQMTDIIAGAESLIETKKETYISGYEVSERQLSHHDANYNPIGGNSEQACAACNWFVSPDGCVLVSGAISPTGISSHYMPHVEHTMEPVPVTIVKDYDSEKTESAEPKKKKRKSFFEFVTKVFGSAPEGTPKPPVQPINFIKQADGRIRYVLLVTNNFKDRDGEIITEDAHKEYVSFVDETGLHSELWLWHTKGTRIGMADWVDYSNGVLVKSGLIDKDKEWIVDSLNDETLAISHGFLGVVKDKTITMYRTYEDSILPRRYASNVYTAVNFFRESKEVAFSEAKKSWLAEKLGNVDIVTEYEKATEELQSQLVAAGIEHKAFEPAVDSQLGEEITAMVKAFTDFANNTNTRLAEVEKSIDERVASVFEARVAALPKAFEASSSDSNVVTGATKEAASGDTRWLDDVFANMVGGQRA